MQIEYLGVAKYIQEEFALKRLGAEAAKLGKRVFVLGGETALAVSGDAIAESLDASGLKYSFNTFRGFCTDEQIDRYVQEAEARGCDIILGAGGGKCVDTAKGIAVKAKKRVILVPTTAAQCACYANIIIIYDENGDTKSVLDVVSPIDLVIADTDILVRRCPVRYLAAGIGDSMSKRPEIDFSLRYYPDWEKDIMAYTSYDLAVKTWELYTKTAARACADMERGVISQELNDVICANIAVTGICSNMVRGGKQIAVSHNAYNGVCRLWKEQQKRYVHGEIVSMTLPLQMALNGEPEGETRRARDMLAALGVPMKPADMQKAPSEENFDALLDYICEHVPHLTAGMRVRVKDAMRLYWR